MDRGSHSDTCGTAVSGICHCDCNGREHGIKHLGKDLAAARAKIKTEKAAGGGYRVTGPDGLPPGGGTREEKIEHRAKQVKVKTHATDTGGRITQEEAYRRMHGDKAGDEKFGPRDRDKKPAERPEYSKGAQSLVAFADASEASAKLHADDPTMARFRDKFSRLADYNKVSKDPAHMQELTPADRARVVAAIKPLETHGSHEVSARVAKHLSEGTGEKHEQKVHRQVPEHVQDIKNLLAGKPTKSKLPATVQLSQASPEQIKADLTRDERDRMHEKIVEMRNGLPAGAERDRDYLNRAEAHLELVDGPRVIADGKSITRAEAYRRMHGDAAGDVFEAKQKELTEARLRLDELGRQNPGGSIKRKSFGVRVDAGLKRLAAQVKVVKDLEAEVKRLEKGPARQAPAAGSFTAESLAGKKYVKTRFGWFEVSKVNKTTVKVKMPFGDRVIEENIAVKKVIDAR